MSLCKVLLGYKERVGKGVDHYKIAILFLYTQIQSIFLFPRQYLTKYLMIHDRIDIMKNKSG